MVNNGEAIAAVVLLGLLASEVGEIVRVPEKQPGVHALPAPATGPHLHYHNPQLPSGDVTVAATPLKLQLTLGAVAAAANH